MPNKGKEGKIFEQQFKTSAMKEGLFILRLNDSSLSWQHERTSKFTVENPCDFILYYNGYLFPVELKSTQYTSFSIERESGKKAMIKMHQWNSLSNFSLFEGVIPGLVLNFRDKDTNEEDTYFVTIQDFVNFMEDSGKASINKNDVIGLSHTFKLSQELKRVHYLYGVKEMLDQAITTYEKRKGKEEK